MSSRQHPTTLQIPNIIIYFICRIESSFPDERTSFVKTFCQHFMNRVDKYGETQENQNNTQHNDGIQENTQEKEDISLLENDKYYTDDDIYNTIKTCPFQLVLCTFIPYIIHNRFMCPFKDINNEFHKLIQHINKKMNMNIPSIKPAYELSGFLKSSLKLIHLPCSNDSNKNNENYHNLYSKFGRISHFELLLLSHSKYFDKYLLDFNNLFYSLMYDNNGALTLSKREYLGLMASSRYSCIPIIMQCEQRYIKLNGDLTWIKSGIKCAPSKYVKLTKINALLAHQPWLIKKQHINELLTGDNPWTISQLIQCFIILIMYHFLCGMYYGLCITPELDQYIQSILQQQQFLILNTKNKNHIFKQQPQLYNNNNNNNNNKEKDSIEQEENKNIIQLLSKKQQQKIKHCKNDKDFEQSALINELNDSDDSLSMEFDPNLAPNNNNNNIKEEKEEKKKEYNNNKKKKKKTNNNNNNNKKKKKKKKRRICPPETGGILYWKYSLGIDMIYSDFDCHKNYQIHAYDFNWDKHGYALISKYYPGMEKKMDKVFKTAYNMTDNSINNKNNLDTEPFRIAVWHYTFRLYGVNNDSYEYSYINFYLPIKLKIFIKKLVCYPQIITINDFNKMGVALKEQEKIHIAILALTAKYQASLLFALRGIMKYIQSN